MPKTKVQSNVSKKPVLERDFHRNEDLGYEPEGRYGCIRYLEHGTPNPLIRWHYHEEYELHLIVNTSGKVFVGDYIGRFRPGNFVLTGPRLPHNWISSGVLGEDSEVRDRVLQFSDESLRKSSEWLPELKAIFPLLERSRHGIEFFGIGDYANEKINAIQQLTGLERLTEFFGLMCTLAEHQDYQLLSSVKLQSFENDASLDQISEVVAYISENYATSFTLADIAKRVNMSESGFSRYFRRMTGNTFTDFVNRLRINRACQLLVETDQYINSICYSVGYNNLANFNRRFIELKGVSPREYRKMGEERYGS